MKIDFSHLDLKKGIAQVPIAVQVLRDTPAFIRNHQLWNGFLDHKWILILTILIMGTLSVTLYNDIRDYFLPSEKEIELDISMEKMENEIVELEAMSLFNPEEAKANLEEKTKSLAKAKEELKKNHKPLFSGSYKFLILIFLEVLIFHFAVGTNNILKKEKRLLTIEEFCRAQFRMVKIMGHKWVYGLVMYILVSIACSILKISYLTNFIMFFVYGFFLGFAFLDNYLEQYHFSIKKSSKQIQTHFGAATVLGIFASIGILIPVIGPILIPFICAVAATIYGHEVGLEEEALSMA